MKKAFTMIELVFVIIVIGILAAVIVPNTRTNPVQEAAIKLSSDIRYTKHLALVNDKYGGLSNPDWYKDRWQLTFNGTKYSIESDNNSTYAKDPISKENIQNIDLGTKYGIASITFKDGCANTDTLSFDTMGRPMIGDLNLLTTAYNSNRLLDENCTIEISNGSELVTIKIVPETGYILIVN